jgi:hypothetical protein
VSCKQNQVFTHETIASTFAVFDWKFNQANRLKDQFPEHADAEKIQSLQSLQIHKFPADAATCGLTDMMLGRVIYCVTGCRLYTGIPLHSLITSFQKNFNRSPASLGDCAVWFRKQSLEDIISQGFYCLLGPGDILVVPSGYMILECCLGTTGCEVITWTCLYPSGRSGANTWRVQSTFVHQQGLLDIPDEAPEKFQKILGHLKSGLQLMDKFLLLAEVKQEDPRDRSRSPRRKLHAAPSTTSAVAATTAGIDYSKIDFGLGLPDTCTVSDLCDALRRYYKQAGGNVC